MPCDGGVLEFGTFTKDRRGNTFGGEYQEAAREYRRTVFTNDNWAGHRSEGLKSLETIFDSGVLRGRYAEIATVGAVATATVLWNALASGYVDFETVKQVLRRAPPAPDLRTDVPLPPSMMIETHNYKHMSDRNDDPEVASEMAHAAQHTPHAPSPPAPSSASHL